jgi:hypothetical protein
MLKLMKCTFELTNLYDLLTYFKTITAKVAKVVMFGIKPKLTKCRFELTYRFELTHFYDLLTYLMTVRGTSTSRKEDT